MIPSKSESESKSFPPATMLSLKADRRLPRIKMSVWLVTALVAVLCTSTEAKDTPVS